MSTITAADLKVGHILNGVRVDEIRYTATRVYYNGSQWLPKTARVEAGIPAHWPGQPGATTVTADGALVTAVGMR